MDRNIFRPGGLALTEKYADPLGLNESSAVLDIGCGRGDTLAFLNRKYGCRVCGADISQFAAETASENVPAADIRCEDAARLSFEDGRFDAVFMECILTLFKDPFSALKEAYRVLMDGGVLIISVITGPGPELVSGGAAEPHRLAEALESIGFDDIQHHDEKYVLTQMYCDLIFEYGSIEEYLKDAERRLGGAVLNCNMNHKSISYGVFTARRSFRIP